MTIPDLGHCAGSGAQPIADSVRDEDGGQTAVCGACSGRFELKHDGTMVLHAAAEIEDRVSAR